jgi:hypothetical protein
MNRKGSNRSDIIKLSGLIERYTHYEDNSMAKAELINIPLNGEDLIDALDNIILKRDSEKYERLKGEYEDLKANYEGAHKYYEQQKEDQKKLIDTLELILEEPFIKKIINLPNILKEVKYP